MVSDSPTGHVIDFDAPPLIPAGSGWEVRPQDQIASRVQGKWKLDQSGLFLYLSEIQEQGNEIIGKDLRKELRSKKVMGAQLLDFYIANRHLIPNEWWGKEVFFWGTIYRDPGGHFFVRHLSKDGKTWWWCYDWLGFKWKAKKPALLAK